MAYTKTTWASGDRITANKLNNIEGGVESANSPFFDINVSLDGTDVVIDKTYDQIKAAHETGKILRALTGRPYKANTSASTTYYYNLNSLDTSPSSENPGFMFTNVFVQNNAYGKKIVLSRIAIYDDSTFWVDAAIDLT